MTGNRRSRRGWRAVRRLWALGALVTALGSILSVSAQPEPRRVLAIGDIHGAGDRFAALLAQSALVDAERRWIGGRSILIQTGDFTDRGSQVREVMDLLMAIEAGSRSAGGEVRVLLGNHETMNLTANVRDVTPAIFASFASDDTESRREEAYERYEDYVELREEALGRPLPDVQTREAWFQAHPPGFVEYMELMGPDGAYGRWLRDKSIATRVDDGVFLHGGLRPDLEVSNLRELNEQARSELSRFDRHRRHLVDQGVILPYSTFQEIYAAVELEVTYWLEVLFPGPPAPNRPRRTLTADERTHVDVLVDLNSINSWLIFDPNGPLWFRGFARWTEEQGNQAITEVLERYDASRVVVGHSVTPARRILPRFRDRVFLIDTGMLSTAYRGRASALEFVDDQVSAVYLEERVPLAVGGATK